MMQLNYSSEISYQVSLIPREKNVIEPKAMEFYSDDADKLSAMIDTYLDEAETYVMSNETLSDIKNVKAIIVPHAGYIYSGQTAASAYHFIKNKSYEDVFILGTSHNVYFDEVSILNATHYKTPIGEISYSPIAYNLLKNDYINTYDSAHKNEHSIEVQIPYIQSVLPNAKIVPMLLGDCDVSKLSVIIDSSLYPDSLIVVSSDFSHYNSLDTAKMLDYDCLSGILDLDSDYAKYCEACNLKGILTLIDIAKKHNWKPILIKYDTSETQTNDKNSVVGYFAIAFTSDEAIVSETNSMIDFNFDELSNDDREYLLKLSRNTIQAFLLGSKPDMPDESELSEALLSKRGCFVTINKNDDLRGCIGSIVPQSKLYECVISNSINAAINDNRFESLKIDELNDIEIEISKLSLTKTLDNSNKDIILNSLTRNEGIILSKGILKGTYLPQIWDVLPEKTDFLESLCGKAGMNNDCWYDDTVNFEVYYAEIFSE